MWLYNYATKVFDWSRIANPYQGAPKVKCFGPGVWASKDLTWKELWFPCWRTGGHKMLENFKSAAQR